MSVSLKPSRISESDYSERIADAFVRVLFDFITSSERTKWLFVEDKFKVFVRKTKRLYAKPAHMEGRLPFPSRQAFSFDCIDIGSIEIQPGYQN
jgi:hypothetical protein